MLSCCNFNDIDIITGIGTIGTMYFGNFATTQINMNKENFYLLPNNTNKDYNANIYKYKQFYISFKILLNKRFLVFKIQGLYCHELIFYKWVDLQILG